MEPAGLGRRHVSCSRRESPPPDTDHEAVLWRRGMRFVAGLDEAGRGALAGPVMVGAVVLAPWMVVHGVQDSKRLSPQRRSDLFETISRQALAVGVGSASAQEVDRLNVWRATCLAARRALRALPVPVDHVLMDGSLEISGIILPQTAIVDGDAQSLSIASASIVAKVRRDRAMALLAYACPLYGFHRHKGYGTADHLARIRRFGPASCHRVSFAPLAQQELW
ncbi:ribonuclease HII [Candidatus Fermentibacteria bacterium]|nr:ribonuclease HII [Candidatus Fermentibacteria bacterium]